MHVRSLKRHQVFQQFPSFGACHARMKVSSTGVCACFNFDPILAQWSFRRNEGCITAAKMWAVAFNTLSEQLLRFDQFFLS